MSISTRERTSSFDGSAWASWLGAVAVVFGILAASGYGTELMRQVVSVQPTLSAGRVSAAGCREERLKEERLSLAECRQMVANFESLTISRPQWFRSVQIGVAAAGIVAALASMIVGIALIAGLHWARVGAILTFAALLALDTLGILAALNAGPIIRQMYLSNILLWFFIHLMMTIAAVAGRDSEAAQAEPAGR